MQRIPCTMRHDDLEDPKKPRYVSLRRKGDNAMEAEEYQPREVRPRRKRGDDHDRHSHVTG